MDEIEALPGFPIHQACPLTTEPHNFPCGVMASGNDCSMAGVASKCLYANRTKDGGYARNDGKDD